MSKIYAVIDPASSYDGSITDVASPIINLFHYLSYEKICGYSLGSYVTFFNSLDAAKNFIAPEKGTMNKDVLQVRCQSAIIEFDATDDDILSLDCVHTVSKVVHNYGESEYGRFEKLWIPTWEERDITPEDVSENAETELWKKLQYQRYMRTHALEVVEATMIRPEEGRAIMYSSYKACASLMGLMVAALAEDLNIPALAYLIASASLLNAGREAYNTFDQCSKVSQRKSDYLNNNIFTPRKQEPQIEADNQAVLSNRR